MSNFWSNQTRAPKRSYRFKVEIAGTAIWWAKNVNTPSFDVGEIEHSYLGKKYYFPGKVSWSEISMTLVDPIAPDSVAFTNSLLVASGSIVPKDANSEIEFKTIDKASAINAQQLSVSIVVLDADGSELEIWTLNQAFLKSAKFGDLSYEDENLRTVELTWRYDWASCQFTGKADPEAQGTFFEAGAENVGKSNYGFGSGGGNTN